MANQVSAAEAYKMYVLYQQLGTYKAVAAALHRSPDTVSKYVKLCQAQSGRAETFGTAFILK